MLLKMRVFVFGAKKLKCSGGMKRCPKRRTKPLWKGKWFKKDIGKRNHASTEQDVEDMESIVGGIASVKFNSQCNKLSMINFAGLNGVAEVLLTTLQ